ETLDDCLSKIIPKALASGYEILLTADHGNAEFMKYKNGEDCPAHTLNPVFCVLISARPELQKVRLKKSRDLGLKNIAPTILDLLGLKPPHEMTAKTLILH
ncbi:MAG: 2,3-bisphosphoglycerate-independent phosphoglycerate mutase, partial [Candidatus Peregrinibacteria bacterium]